MILDSEPWFISIEPRTCFRLTKSTQKNIKALGERGMYPWFLRFPDRHRLCVGAGAGVSAGEKRMTVHNDRDVGFDKLDVGGDSQRYLWKWWDFERVRGDQMIDTITGITGYLGVTSAKIFAGVCPYKDDSS